MSFHGFSTLYKLLYYASVTCGCSQQASVQKTNKQNRHRQTKKPTKTTTKQNRAWKTRVKEPNVIEVTPSSAPLSQN